jgi:hypothetical protein
MLCKGLAVKVEYLYSLLTSFCSLERGPQRELKSLPA